MELDKTNLGEQSQLHIPHQSGTVSNACVISAMKAPISIAGGLSRSGGRFTAALAHSARYKPRATAAGLLGLTVVGSCSATWLSTGRIIPRLRKR